LATRHLVIDVGVAVALCDHQVILVKKITSFTADARLAGDERSPTNAELRGKPKIAVELQSASPRLEVVLAAQGQATLVCVVEEDHRAICTGAEASSANPRKGRGCVEH